MLVKTALDLDASQDVKPRWKLTNLNVNVDMYLCIHNSITPEEKEKQGVVGGRERGAGAVAEQQGL